MAECFQRPITLCIHAGGVSRDPLLRAVPDPNPIVSLKNSVSLLRKRNSMASSNSNRRTDNYLRHMESMKILPSGAGHISHLNAVILGESLATEEDDFVLPNKEFASQANVQSPEQVLNSSYPSEI